MTAQELAKALSTDLLSKPNKKVLITSFSKALDKEKIGTAELIKILLSYSTYLPQQVEVYKKIMDAKTAGAKQKRIAELKAELKELEGK